MANTMKALQTVTVGAGGVSSVAFTNIPQTYTDLVVKISTRSDRVSQLDGLYLYNLGGGQAVNLSAGMTQILLGDGSAAVAAPQSTLQISASNGASSTANTFSNTEVYFPNYANQSNLKTYSIDSGVENNSAGNAWTWISSGLISSIEPITSLTFSSGSAAINLVQHSTFTLYGVWNDGTTAIKPATPTIGTATDAATGGQSSVAFTEVSGAASYTMTSTPGSLVGTGTKSPVFVSGLTNGTAYTFKVKANNPLGTSTESAASNSATPSAQYNSIASVSYSVGAGGEVTFYGIPSIYRHLQLRMFTRDTVATASASMLVRFNGNNSSLYSMQGMSQNGSSISAYSIITTSSLQILNAGSSAGASRFAATVMDIFDANQTNKFKAVTLQNGFSNNGSTAVLLTAAGTFQNTQAISSITIMPATSFAQYSHFALYGMG